MDNLTHTLFALTLARTPLGRAGRGTTAALVIASNVPDVDIIAAVQGGTVSYLQWHRGPTHGCFGIVGLGLATAGLVWWAARFSRRHDAPHASFPMLAGVSMIGVLLHVLMDLPTSYGTRILSPFDWHWFAVDWLPIIDIYLLAVLVAGLAFGLLSPAARRRNATIALLLMAADYGLRGAAHHRALALAPRVFGPTLPVHCASIEVRSSPLEVWPPVAAQPPESSKRCLLEVAAVPTFVSPFRWRLIVKLSNAYELREIDLLDSRLLSPAGPPDGFWRTTLRIPNLWTAAVEQAATTRTAQSFLGFARFPAARAFTDGAGVTTVRWSEVRFAGGWLVLNQPATRVQPFNVTVRVSPDGTILEERMER